MHYGDDTPVAEAERVTDATNNEGLQVAKDVTNIDTKVLNKLSPKCQIELKNASQKREPPSQGGNKSQKKRKLPKKKAHSRRKAKKTAKKDTHTKKQRSRRTHKKN